MAIQTIEDLIAPGTYMAITALVPFTGMGSAKYRKYTIMFPELSRFPGVKTVTEFAIFAETGTGMVRTLDIIIIIRMAGITF
jgi:hypothetical protein